MGSRRSLDELRAGRGGVPSASSLPSSVQVHRVSASSAAMALGALVAVGALLLDVGDPSNVVETMRGADWGWLALAFVVAFSANVAYAVALQGTVDGAPPGGRDHRVPARGVVLEPGRARDRRPGHADPVPAEGRRRPSGRGRRRRRARRLRRARRRVRHASGWRCSSTPAASISRSFPPTVLLFTLVGAAALAVVVSGVLAFLPTLRAKVMPPVSRVASAMAEALRSPRLLTLMIGGNVAAYVLSTWCLQFCVIAFGGHVGFLALLAANVAVVAIASIVPVPGGATAVGTVGLSAVLVSFGVPKDIAVAAVLANQLLFYYLPAIPGWFATRDLVRRRVSLSSATAPAHHTWQPSLPCRISVALSGGGHRAAAWGLGTLYGVLAMRDAEAVKGDAGVPVEFTAIASVSGGSIANGVVADQLRRCSRSTSTTSTSPTSAASPRRSSRRSPRPD